MHVRVFLVCSPSSVSVGPAEAAPVVAQAAPELPVAAAAEAAAAAAAAAAPAAPVEPEHEEMIALSLKTLRGTSTLIEVPAHATFGHIKHQYVLGCGVVWFGVRCV